jgi:hypothetical protein
MQVECGKPAIYFDKEAALSAESGILQLSGSTGGRADWCLATWAVAIQ